QPAKCKEQIHYNQIQDTTSPVPDPFPVHKQREPCSVLNFKQGLPGTRQTRLSAFWELPMLPLPVTIHYACYWGASTLQAKRTA
ncbi:MAG: hypothetical protein QX198_01730, partial [Methylococcaceae bacterium]